MVKRGGAIFENPSKKARLDRGERSRSRLPPCLSFKARKANSPVAQIVGLPGGAGQKARAGRTGSAQ